MKCTCAKKRVCHICYFAERHSERPKNFATLKHVFCVSHRVMYGRSLRKYYPKIMPGTI